MIAKKQNSLKSFHISLMVLVFFIGLISFSLINQAKSVDLEKEEFRTIVRMSEVLGAVYYLDSLCGVKNAIMWRDDMDSMLDSYQFPKAARTKMINSFNKSFNSYKATYNFCSKRAKAVAKSFYKEGAKLAQQIAVSK